MEIINYTYSSTGEKTGFFLNYEKIKKNKISDIEKFIENLLISNAKKSEEKKEDDELWAKRLSDFRELMKETKKYNIKIDPKINISELANEMNDVIL